ncbi:MAG TPA: hypothetical protein VG206_17660 [Terriglobia bacterium]|nr:hypothetical protein [Terriglobia bacterium]
MGRTAGRLLCLLPIFSVTLLAQSGTCTTATISGKYGYAIQGLIYQTGSLIPFAEAGSLTADGNGNFTGSEIYSEGTPTPRSSYGTYTVNSDCTGAAHFADTGSQVSFVVTANGQQVDFIESDAGTVISGTAKRQQTNCASGSISGAYGFALEGWYFDASGLAWAFADSGKVVSDGAGRLSLADTTSYGGTVSSRAISGGALVNADCTGTASFTDSQGNTSHLNFVVVSGGREIQFIETDASTVISGGSSVLADVTPGSGSMAQVASGSGWQTEFTLVNTGSSAAQAQLSFFGDDGSPLALPLTMVQSSATNTASSVTQTIAPGSQLVIVTSAPSTSPQVVGSAQLTSTGNIGGFAIFRYNPAGQEAVVPLETRNAEAYLLAFDDTNGLATGLALANSSNQAVSVPVLLTDETGASLGSAAISLPALGHTSFMLATAYPAVAGKRGTVEFDTPPGGQISVLGLRATAALALTTIPVLTK